MVPNGPRKTLVTHRVLAIPGPAASRVSLVMMVAAPSRPRWWPPPFR